MKPINRMQAGIVLLGIMNLTNVAFAGHGAEREGSSASERFAVNARVVNVEPLVRLVQVTVPQEVCWEEPVRRSASNYTSATPKVLGGIVGGVVGNTMGRGRGNTLMTIAGALLGASVGRDVAYQKAQRNSGYVSYERVCEIEQVTHEEERNDGYRVTYEYGGREFVTYTDVEPGKYIRVRVHLEPVAYNPSVTGVPTGNLFVPNRKRYSS